jgi:hypothetical protein
VRRMVPVLFFLAVDLITFGQTVGHFDRVVPLCRHNALTVMSGVVVYRNGTAGLRCHIGHAA